MDINKAVEFIIGKHKGEKHIGVKDYYSHPITVAELISSKGLSQDMIVTALFHDLLEETDATENEILELSNMRVLEAVKLLTKYIGYNMSQYILQIQSNEMALYVKLADRIYNLESVIVASERLKCRYIVETEKYYIPLSIGSIFEEQMMISLGSLKKSI